MLTKRPSDNFDTAGRQIVYKTIQQEVFSEDVKEEERIYNENSWLMATIQKKNYGDAYEIRTDYENLTAMGFPQQQTIDYQDGDRNVDHLDYTYVGWDTWRVAVIRGFRSNRHGTSGYAYTYNYVGPNGEPNAITGADDPESASKYFMTTPEGLILHRMHFSRVRKDFLCINLDTYYFYRVNGNYLASYKKRGGEVFDLTLNWVRPQGKAGQEIGLRSTQDFSSLPQIYICVAGDSYESIARNLYGDASLASYIDAANGGGALLAGQTIVIPQLMSVHNQAGMAQPYYQFLQIIQGALTPHLDTPQPHHSFWGMVFKALVVVVLCIVVPELAPQLAYAFTAALGPTLATALGVGLADAAAQGLCIGLGMQDHFSLDELAATMITVGFGSQLGPASLDMEYILKAGMINVEEQLAEMAIGIRQQFDIAGVALAMGSAGLSKEIKIENPYSRRALADIAVAGMSSVVRGRFDVENLATQLITDAAAVGMQQQRTKPISEDYHQSQKASRGEFNLSPWESQLINDANFTANTELPSIRLDTNDEDLAQRIGEDVSHFYHPTPPPRNPSGFWQGVNDVLKMREGTIKAAELIRGHYEAPRDLWETAGFVIGAAPLALSSVRVGAEKLGAEVIENAYQGGQQLGKGLIQASRLMNRWGFWNNKDTESSLLPVKATKLGDFDAYNPGLLSRRPALSFLGQRYSSFRLKEDLILYRAGSNNQSLGEYFSLDRPDSELQLRIDKAIRPSWPDGGKSIIDTAYQIKIPRGVNVHIGEVAPQGDIFLGGTQQIFIEKPWLISGVEILNKFPLKEELLWNPSLR